MQVSSEQRLSRISTLWTLLERAHDPPTDNAALARRALLLRYSGAAYSYLLGAVRDEEAAMELFQEFALRILRGDFRGADPARGSFRAYVKTALINLVNEYWRRRRNEPVALVADPAAPSDTPAEESTDEFAAAWKRQLMDCAWDALRDENLVLHTVLFLHVQNNQISSQSVADEIARKFDRDCTANNARVMLHRARDKFAELLLEQVRQSMPQSTVQDLVTELRELNLLKQCESAMAKRGMKQT